MVEVRYDEVDTRYMCGIMDYVLVVLMINMFDFIWANIDNDHVYICMGIINNILYYLEAHQGVYIPKVCMHEFL